MLKNAYLGAKIGGRSGCKILFFSFPFYILRARSPLYRSRFLHPNTHFSALIFSRTTRFSHFCTALIYKNSLKTFANFEQCLKHFLQMEAVQKYENLVVLENLMLKNAYLGAKIGFDTAANELTKIWPLPVYRSPRYQLN